MSSRVRRAVPDRPGVYRMLGRGGNVLYVGKATSLKQRVRSYFQESARHPEHILEMLTQARELELVVTGTPLEAALEEADTIKRLSPPYNRALRTRDRSLVFATPDLTHVATSPNPRHRIGPLAGGDLWRAVEAMLRGSLEEVEPTLALAMAERNGPEADTFRVGCELFGRELGQSSLLAMGARLWSVRLHASDEEEQEEFKLAMQADPAAERWSPERVAARLREIVERAAHQVRRAHWLRLLSESTLVWDACALVLENGRVQARHRWTGERNVPLSRSIETPVAERCHYFDLATYDRLIVLTREIRRLLSDGQPIALHIGRAREIGVDRLRAMLRWI